MQGLKMADFEGRERKKQKPQRMDVVDWAVLHEIGKAIEAKQSGLTQVRRDSPEWAAWRQWFRDHGMSTAWCDRQNPEHLLTVTLPYPPADIEAEYVKWVKGRAGKLLELRA